MGEDELHVVGPEIPHLGHDVVMRARGHALPPRIEVLIQADQVSGDVLVRSWYGSLGVLQIVGMVVVAQTSECSMICDSSSPTATSPSPSATTRPRNRSERRMSRSHISLRPSGDGLL